MKHLLLWCLIVLAGGMIIKSVTTVSPVIDDAVPEHVTATMSVVPGSQQSEIVSPYTKIRCYLMTTSTPAAPTSAVITIDWSKVPTPTCYVKQTPDYELVLAVTKWDRFNSNSDYCSLRTDAYQDVHTGYCEISSADIPARLDQLVEEWYEREYSID